MWTVLTIGIATVLVTTTIIVVMKVKNKHNNSLTGNVSTTDISIVNELFTTINVALTTKTSHSETIITTGNSIVVSKSDDLLCGFQCHIEY